MTRSQTERLGGFDDVVLIRIYPVMTELRSLFQDFHLDLYAAGVLSAFWTAKVRIRRYMRSMWMIFDGLDGARSSFGADYWGYMFVMFVDQTGKVAW